LLAVVKLFQKNIIIFIFVIFGFIVEFPLLLLLLMFLHFTRIYYVSTYFFLC
jgi:hypothetical protein